METTEQKPQTEIASSHKYASNIRRFAAYGFDAIIIGIISLVLQFTFAGNVFSQDASQASQFSPQRVTASVISSIIGAFYFVGFWVKRNGQTPGKQFMHIRIVREHNEHIDWFTGFVRWLSQLLSAAVFMLGYIWILFDSKKQGWHDKIAKTYVIETDEPKPNGCLTALGCVLPLVFAILMFTIAFFVVFTQTGTLEKIMLNRTKTQTETPQMGEEAQAHLNKSKDLFNQIKAASAEADTESVKKLNDENIAELKQAVDLEPNNALLWFTLSNAYSWISTTGTLEDGLSAAKKGIYGKT